MQNKHVVIGKLGSTYGVRGWIKVQAFTEIITDVLQYTPWSIKDKGEWKTIQIESAKHHGKGMIVKLIGYDTPEQVNKLTGKEITILHSQLPKLKKDEYYWGDLEGLTVIDQHGKVLGKVIYLITTGTNDVLIVKGKKEFAIPYLLGDVITQIDLDKQEMLVNWEIV